MAENIYEQLKSEVLIPPDEIYAIMGESYVEENWFVKVISNGLSWMEDTYFNDLSAQELYNAAENAYRNEDEKCHDYPKNHTIRVALMASYLYRTVIASEAVDADRNRKNLISRIYFKLMQAIVWHDMGKVYHTTLKDHGVVSYAIYLENCYKEDKLIEFFMVYHCRPDKDAYEYFRKCFSRRQGKDIIWTAFQLMKDANALDHWIFENSNEDFADVNILRNPLSRQLIPIAAALQTKF